MGGGGGLRIYCDDYLRDINWVTYLGGMYLWGLIYGGRVNEILLLLPL